MGFNCRMGRKTNTHNAGMCLRGKRTEIAQMVERPSIVKTSGFLENHTIGFVLIHKWNFSKMKMIYLNAHRDTNYSLYGKYLFEI